MTIEKMTETREQFVPLAQEIAPLIEQMAKILKKHGVTEMVDVTISKDYQKFEVYDHSGWKMVRYGEKDAFLATNDYKEPLYPEQEEKA